MILRELVLHNFGAYQGRHTISLESPNPDRPITLIGALNGSGKTTILDALRLALYGPRAPLAGRAGYPYDEYLRRAIHRSVLPSDGASVEVEYSTQLDGEPTTLRIRRSWSERGKGIRENLDVLRNGEFDRVLTDTWSDYIQEFFPLEISELFFFDGEKIADLADPRRSSALMRTAVHSLLGVNLIDQLDTDLTVLQRRKRADLRTEDEATEVERLRAHVEQAKTQNETDTQRMAAARTSLERLHLRLEEVESAYRRKGGEAYEQRTATELEHAAFLERRSMEYNTLRDLAAGEAPLLLIRNQLEELEATVERERSSEVAVALLKELESRDQSVIELADRYDAQAAGQIEAFLAANRTAWQKKAAIESTLRLTGQGSTQLRYLLTGGLDNVSRELSDALARTETAERHVIDAERKLSAIPDPASIESILRTRSELLDQIQAASIEYKVAAEATSRSEIELERRRARYANALDRQVEREFAEESATRVIDHATRVRSILGGFRSAVVAEHIERIEAAVLEAFQALVRKETLARGLRLDPQSMDLELTDSRGKAIPTDQLSAGERQMLAVAMLWGLARVSGKRLPTVIDTPLARLDGIHRERISTRYFPVASHQVVVLSTDEEVDADLYHELEPHIGRSYTLEYDDDTDGTSIVDGYHLIQEPAHAN